MAEPIKFTELTNAGELSLSAIMAIVQQQAGELVSLQCSMAQVAELVASSAVYADLTTEQKKLIDAINELNAGKQKKLIAGANITINEETGEISSTGGGGGFDYSIVADVTLEEATTKWDIPFGLDKKELIVHLFLPFYQSDIAVSAIKGYLYQNDSGKTGSMISYVNSSDNNYWFTYRLNITEGLTPNTRRIVGDYYESHATSFSINGGSNASALQGIYHQSAHQNYKFTGFRVEQANGVPIGSRIIILAR